MCSWVDDLNRRRSGWLLSADVVRSLRNSQDLTPEAARFVGRSFEWMIKSGRSPRDVTPRMADWFLHAARVFAPQVLRGDVLGTTFAGRYGTANATLAKYLQRSSETALRVLEIGCGVPPFGVTEAAALYPRVEFTGLELSWPVLLVLTQAGAVVRLNAQLAPESIQLSPMTSAFSDGLSTAVSDVEDAINGLGPASVMESTGHWAEQSPTASVIREPRKFYSRGNLLCVDSRSYETPRNHFHVVRSMNVLQYYEGSDRNRIRSMARDALVEGGVFISGTSFIESLESRLTVEQKRDGMLVPVEASVGFDNLRPLGINLWIDIHGDGFEVAPLSGLLAVVAANLDFEQELARAFDRAAESTKFAWRDSNGYLVESDPGAPIGAVYSRILQLYRVLQDQGLQQRASEALTEAGLECVAEEGVGLVVRHFSFQ